jgi:hypothetical protein
MSPSLRAGCTRAPVHSRGQRTSDGNSFSHSESDRRLRRIGCTVCAEMGAEMVGVFGGKGIQQAGADTLHRNIQVASDTCHPRAGQDLLDATTQSPRGPSEQISASLLVNNQLAQSMSTHPRQWCIAPALQRSTLPKLNSISTDRCSPTWSAACAARAYIERVRFLCAADRAAGTQR